MPRRRTDAEAIRALHARAVDQYNRGRPVDALATLRRAITMLGFVDDSAVSDIGHLAVRLWISVAASEAELHTAQAADAALNKAAELALRNDDRLGIALVHAQRGAIALRDERPADALEAFVALGPVLAALPDADRATALSNRGIALMLLGDLRHGREYFERAVELARNADMRAAQFRARFNLAYLDYLAGDLPAALAGFDEAAAVGVVGGSDGRAGLALARVLIEAGLYGRADDTLERAAAYARAHRVQRDVAEISLERAGIALVTGDIATARRLAGRARDILQRRRNDLWRHAALLLLHADLAAGRPGSRLVPPALELSASFAADGLRVPARTAALIAAEALLVAGRIDDAADTLASAPRGRPSDPVGVRLHAGFVAARLADERGDRPGAARLVRRGLGQVAEHQARLGSLDLRTASAVHGRRLAAFGLQLALRDGRAQSVFVAAERARAMSTRLDPVRPPKDPVTAQLYAELRQEIDAAMGVLQDPAAIEAHARRRADIERRIAARSWSLPGSGRVRPLAALNDVRAQGQREDACIVMYIEVAGDLSALVIDARKTRLHRLGAAAPVVELARRLRADLDVVADARLPAPLRTAVETSLARTCAAMDAAVLHPLGSFARVVIISTGVLGQVPWGILPGLGGVPVTVAPSATAWLAACAADRRRNSGVVAAAGPGLSRGDAEIREVATTWPGATSVVGADADRASVRSAMAGARLLHVAAHGVHQPENPLFSTLRLSDGVLFAHELDDSRRTPQHVVLSACEVGLATVRPGDEALGLTSVLLRLGTRSVVAGVARVNDDVAASTMTDYHRRLAAGADTARALAEATAAADGVAPFVCFGATWQAKGFGPATRRRVP